MRVVEENARIAERQYSGVQEVDVVIDWFRGKRIRNGISRIRERIVRNGKSWSDLLKLD